MPRDIVTSVAWATVDDFPQESSCHQEMVNRRRTNSISVDVGEVNWIVSPHRHNAHPLQCTTNSPRVVIISARIIVEVRGTDQLAPDVDLHQALHLSEGGEQLRVVECLQLGVAGHVSIYPQDFAGGEIEHLSLKPTYMYLPRP